MIKSSNVLSRKRALTALGIAAGSALAPSFATKALGAANGRVVINADGGAYQDAEQKAIYEPFTRETGIEVVIVPSNATQVLAMVQSGSVQLDVLDNAEAQMLMLDKQGALAPIEYDKFKFTNPADLIPNIRRKNMTGNIYYATVLGYSKKNFSGNAYPKSWADFWNTTRFSGSRSLESANAGLVPLEFALLADGVPLDKIYPIDLDRAFNVLAKLRSHVSKWWTTGAESIELLESGEVSAVGLWNGRIQGPIDQGAAYGITWNGAMRLKQFWGVIKNAPNPQNAQKFVDFALQPHVQANLAKYIPYGPTNKKAIPFIAKTDLEKLPSAPAHYGAGFDEDAQWWTDHLQEVVLRWQKWLVS